MEIEIEKIKIRKDIYPRFNVDQDAIDRYRLNLDKLPPVLISADYTLIDGFHRLHAHQLEGKMRIQVEQVDIPEERYFYESLKLNSKHGQQLSLKEKEKAAQRLFNDGATRDEIKNLLAITYETVRRWTAEQQRQQDNERNAQIWDMWLACETEEKIAEGINLSQKQVNQIILEQKQEIAKGIIIPDPLRFYNLWDFGKAAKEYGENYPGRMPGQVVENLFYYYTEPFGIVLDPMAGGGTTIDVCKKMNRRYLAYDLLGNPLKNIQQHDIIESFPVKKFFPPDFILLDPPYWSQKKGQYSEHLTNLANMELPDYYSAIAKIIKEAYKILKKGGYIAFIISPSQIKKQIYDHAFQVYKMLEAQFEFVNRIIVPYTTQQVTGPQMTQAREGKYMLKLYRDLLIFQKTNGK